ncbi:hypothetical protein DFH08DRAFT_884134 [Mycena albidolilacea]|uniref:Uncharacterized protein n=1 Tax=Mycena albidolilacea TaxID=1033008 RepID=A0AAD6ZKY1_9AGAR|nr:hypothetical protein DFH08DRAFT_884134 [Mycena albidolilacea]
MCSGIFSRRVTKYASRSRTAMGERKGCEDVGWATRVTKLCHQRAVVTIQKERTSASLALLSASLTLLSVIIRRISTFRLLNAIFVLKQWIQDFWGSDSSSGSVTATLIDRSSMYSSKLGPESNSCSMCQMSIWPYAIAHSISCDNVFSHVGPNAPSSGVVGSTV